MARHPTKMPINITSTTKILSNIVSIPLIKIGSLALAVMGAVALGPQKPETRQIPSPRLKVSRVLCQ
jgi:hypothetical protein